MQLTQGVYRPGYHDQRVLIINYMARSDAIASEERVACHVELWIQVNSSLGA